MRGIAVNLIQVRDRIELAALAAKREPEEIQLMAVSKLFPASMVEEAMHAGQTCFGENYVQEGVEKIQKLAKLRPWLEWHFIGPLQSNKTKEVAHNFDWVESIDRLKIAERLSAQRLELPEILPLQVCVQVNVSNEESKSGVPIEEATALCDAVAQLPGADFTWTDGHSRAQHRPRRATRGVRQNEGAVCANSASPLGRSRLRLF
jgi:PLP dependent protein